MQMLGKPLLCVTVLPHTALPFAQAKKNEVCDIRENCYRLSKRSLSLSLREFLTSLSQGPSHLHNFMWLLFFISCLLMILYLLSESWPAYPSCFIKGNFSVFFFFFLGVLSLSTIVILGPNSSLLWEAVLGSVGKLATTLVSTHKMPAAASAFRPKHQTYLQTLLNVPWGGENTLSWESLV